MAKKSGVLDREATKSLVLQVVASDSAPVGSRKSTTVPVNVTVADENDNPPLFVQKDYAATIVDNIPFYPDPSPIVQVVLKSRFSLSGFKGKIRNSLFAKKVCSY